jgi:hypothetical protein
MYSLCTNPTLVTKMSRARLMTKGHHYRDDPAFLVLQLGFIVISSVAYGLAIEASLWDIITTIFANVLWFLFIGLLLACIGRAVAVMYLPPSSSAHGTSTGSGAAAPNSSNSLDVFSDYLRSDVDWRYAFDVHCNGYFTYFMWTQIIQYPFFVFTRCHPFLANMFYLFGVLTYFYNVFLGYLEIPSLSHQQRLLYPVLVAVALYLLLSLLGINISRKVWGWTWDA